jgi:hypothetical protein
MNASICILIHNDVTINRQAQVPNCYLYEEQLDARAQSLALHQKRRSKLLFLEFAVVNTRTTPIIMP